jgi:hypothetical protein
VAREPAYSPREARARYVRIISLPLTCVTHAQWYEAPTIRGSEEEDRAIQLTGMPNPLRLKRDGQPPVYLSATQGFRLIPDERFAPGAGEWKATTTGYAYTVYETSNHEPLKAMAWHYHPTTGKSHEPHVHIYREGSIGGVELSKLHFPGERVAFESVVTFLINELGVTPLRADWDTLVASALERFVRFRMWPVSGGPQPKSVDPN